MDEPCRLALCRWGVAILWSWGSTSSSDVTGLSVSDDSTTLLAHLPVHALHCIIHLPLPPPFLAPSLESRPGGSLPRDLPTPPLDSLSLSLSLCSHPQLSLWPRGSLPWSPPPSGLMSERRATKTSPNLFAAFQTPCVPPLINLNVMISAFTCGISPDLTDYVLRSATAESTFPLIRPAA